MTGRIVAGAACFRPLLGGFLAVTGFAGVVASMVGELPMPVPIHTMGAQAARAESVGASTLGQDARRLSCVTSSCPVGTHGIPMRQEPTFAPGPFPAIAATRTTPERYGGEGRTLDILATSPPTDPRAAMWAAMARADRASREVQQSDGLAAPPVGNKMMFSTYVPHDVLFGLPLRAPVGSAPAPRAGGDRSPANAGTDTPISPTHDAASGLPP